MSSQDEHYEDEEEGGEEGVLGSSFSQRNAEVQDLPESEDMFLPSDMDTTQLTFRFKEVAASSQFSWKLNTLLRRLAFIIC